MKITDVKTTVVFVPYNAPLRWALGCLPGNVRTIVEVFTEERIVGLGECFSEFNKEIIDKYYRPKIIGGDPFDIEKIMAKCRWSARWSPRGGHSYSLAAVEMALWDIIGKIVDRPVCDLLGGRVRDRIEHVGYIWPRYAGNEGVGGESSPEDIAKFASDVVSQHGFRTLELKLGVFPPRVDIEIVKAIRNELGPDVDIRIDPNKIWSIHTAIRTLREMEKYNLANVEEPTGTLESMAAVRRSVNMPFSTHDLNIDKIVRLGAADAIAGDIQFHGGLIATKNFVALCQRLGLDYWLHTGDELGIHTAAAAHLVASTPYMTHPNQSMSIHMIDDIIKEKFRYKEGTIRVPEGPGLGVEIDRRKLRKYSQLYETEREKLWTFPDFRRPEWVPRIPSW